MKRLRDQRIAHHDAVPTPSDRSVLYGEVQRLVEAIKDMYNRLRRGHGGAYTAFDNLGRDAERHVSDVVRIMREERDRVSTSNEANKWGLEVAERIRISVERLREAVDDTSTARESMRAILEELQDAAHNMWTYWESMNR